MKEKLDLSWKAINATSIYWCCASTNYVLPEDSVSVCE